MTFEQWLKKHAAYDSPDVHDMKDLLWRLGVLEAARENWRDYMDGLGEHQRARQIDREMDEHFRRAEGEL